MAKKVVLAYSGGLDTSVCIHWLMHERGYEVVTFTGDLGQGDLLGPIKKRALQTGARQAFVADLRAVFLKEFCFPALRAGIAYGDGYLLATALGRPLITRELVRVARRVGAEAIAHGCTGKGNDQVRMEATAMALDPDLAVIAPVREWDMKTREEEIAYLRTYGIPCDVTVKKQYSYDHNIWGASIEAGVLEDPWTAPPLDAYTITADPAKAPAKADYVEVGFREGLPVSLNGKALDAVALVDRLNRLGGRHGVGRVDVIEDRLVGIKSREVYEAPGATILYEAHQAIEALTLGKDLREFQAGLSRRYGQLVYNGLWFSDLRAALDAFFVESQKPVTGTARVRLHKGKAVVEGRRGDAPLYDPHLATYSEGDRFDHKAAAGFIKLWSLPQKSEARRKLFAAKRSKRTSKRGR